MLELVTSLLSTLSPQDLNETMISLIPMLLSALCGSLETSSAAAKLLVRLCISNTQPGSKPPGDIVEQQRHFSTVFEEEYFPQLIQIASQSDEYRSRIFFFIADVLLNHDTTFDNQEQLNSYVLLASQLAPPQKLDEKVDALTEIAVIQFVRKVQSRSQLIGTLIRSKLFQRALHPMLSPVDGIDGLLLARESMALAATIPPSCFITLAKQFGILTALQTYLSVNALDTELWPDALNVLARQFNQNQEALWDYLPNRLQLNSPGAIDSIAILLQSDVFWPQKIWEEKVKNPNVWEYVSMTLNSQFPRFRIATYALLRTFVTARWDTWHGAVILLEQIQVMDSLFRKNDFGYEDTVCRYRLLGLLRKQLNLDYVEGAFVERIDKFLKAGVFGRNQDEREIAMEPS